MNCKGKMSFGDFVFPINPYLIRVRHQRTVARQKTLGGQEAVCDMGQNGRIVSGEGEFFGSSAAAYFDELKKRFEEEAVGVLYLPSQKPMIAVFEELELIGEDIGDVIRFRFQFREAPDQGMLKNAGWLISDGEKCLWDYADETGVDVGLLLEMNPNVRRPDAAIESGKKVFFC